MTEMVLTVVLVTLTLSLVAMALTRLRRASRAIDAILAEELGVVPVTRATASGLDRGQVLTAKDMVNPRIV